MEEKILFAEITLKVRTCNLITEERLQTQYEGDMERCVMDEIEANGLTGITDIDTQPEIIRVIKKEYTDNHMFNFNDDEL